MATIADLRAALSKMHKRACGDSSQVYMSVPDPKRDADLLLTTGIDQLEAAQQCLEQIWPLLNTLENDAPIGNAAQKMIANVKRSTALLYEKAMGDR